MKMPQIRKCLHYTLQVLTFSQCYLIRFNIFTTAYHIHHILYCYVTSYPVISIQLYADLNIVHIADIVSYIDFICHIESYHIPVSQQKTNRQESVQTLSASLEVLGHRSDHESSNLELS